jgi:hypothetical protein
MSDTTFEMPEWSVQPLIRNLDFRGVQVIGDGKRRLTHWSLLDFRVARQFEPNLPSGPLRIFPVSIVIRKRRLPIRIATANSNVQLSSLIPLNHGSIYIFLTRVFLDMKQLPAFTARNLASVDQSLDPLSKRIPPIKIVLPEYAWAPRMLENLCVGLFHFPVIRERIGVVML